LLESAGEGARLDRAGALFSGRESATPNLALVRAEAARLPLTIELMERHPQSSQAFFPLAGGRYLVMVCPSTADDAPDLSRLLAFVVGPGQAINYDAGTWHHPMTALDGPATFAMLVWEDGSADDCEFRPIAAEDRITVRV
jgi:ureidoglycolate lyase